MKKVLIVLSLFLLCSSSVSAFQSDDVEVLDTKGLTMENFWQRNGKYEQKILEVGTKIINANKLDKRIPIQMNRSTKIINADSAPNSKTVTVYYGLLPYIDNDDELAYVLGHEMSHSLDSYGGFFKWSIITVNQKAYESKADLVGIDLMTKAGYNPVAAICCANKVFDENYFDFGIFTAHPRGSIRLMNMYKYIYVKYPWALKTDMVNNVNYVNFTYSSKKEINEFLQHQKEREAKQIREDL